MTRVLSLTQKEVRFPTGFSLAFLFFYFYIFKLNQKQRSRNEGLVPRAARAHRRGTRDSFRGTQCLSHRVWFLLLLLLNVLLQWRNKVANFTLGTSSGELQTQKLRVPSDENTELKGSPFKDWSSQYIARHAMPGISSLLISTLPVRSPAFFSKPLPSFSCVSWVGPQNKIGHAAGCRFPCWVPAEYR